MTDKQTDGNRAVVLTGHPEAVYRVSHPDRGSEIARADEDGVLRDADGKSYGGSWDIEHRLNSVDEPWDLAINGDGTAKIHAAGLRVVGRTTSKATLTNCWCITKPATILPGLCCATSRTQ